jgi:DNA-binding response OmpR family regulator
MMDSAVILAVDHNRRNLELLSQYLGQVGYQTRTSSSLEEVDLLLDQADEVRLALVDIGGFDHRIWERCQRLREQHIPFLVLSPKHSAALQQASVSAGARGMLVKPLVVRELLGLIRSLMEEEE